MSFYPKRRESNYLTLRDFLTDSFYPSLWTDRVVDGMRTDIVETDEAYQLTVEMPGVQKENIKLSYVDDELNVSATFNDEINDKAKQGLIYRERRTGQFARSYTIADINGAGIKAKYENGLLIITAPKRQAIPPTNQTITIE